MNCIYCNFKFKKFIVAGGTLQPNEVAPLLCEKCLKISLYKNGHIYPCEGQDLERVKLSPAYINVLRPIIDGIMLREMKTAGAVN